MSEATVIGYCRACGKALDQESAKAAQGTIYCAEHVPITVTPVAVGAPPPLPGGMGSGFAGGSSFAGRSSVGSSAYAGSSFATAQAAPVNAAVSANSPVLAFLLGFIPGVGAVYNGQYAKGLVHVLIMGSIISILANDAANGFEPLFGLLLSCFVFYMAFEAYHTAKKRQEGQPVDEFSSLVPMRSGTRFPMLAILLILFGVLFLLGNLGLLEFHRVLRYWPVLLIGLGLYMLYERMAHHTDSQQGSPQSPYPAPKPEGGER